MYSLVLLHQKIPVNEAKLQASMYIQMKFQWLHEHIRTGYPATVAQLVIKALT